MPESNYPHPNDLRTIAVLGTGSVGASWTSLFLARGYHVLAHDAAPDAEARARAFVANAWPALRSLGIAHDEQPPLDRLRFVASIAEAARAADLIQENVPEKPELKARVLGEADAAASADKLILSSTGGIPPTTLQALCRHPERVVVMHPFNPAHLMPLVEVVGGEHTANAAIEWTLGFARHLGKQPIRLNVELTGHMTNRLQFALVREAVACLLEGVASARDIDAALRYGLAPRWMLMGSLMTLHLAGGPGGMQGILDHAGKAIEQWWTPRSTPQLTPEVVAQLVAAAREVADGGSIEQWVRWRDAQLVEMINLQTQAQAAPR